jgi:predicted ATPase
VAVGAPTVRDLVAARLARLSTGTRRAVEAAAVIGGRVDLSLLSSVLEGSSADECLATGILVADGSGVRFRHELVRMAVEAGIPPYRQTELHARLLAVLEERGDGDPAVLAHHAEGAGQEKAVLRHARLADRPDRRRRCPARRRASDARGPGPGRPPPDHPRRRLTRNVQLEATGG